MILFLELFTFIILLNFEVLRKVTFMIFVFYFFIGFRNHYFYPREEDLHTCAEHPHVPE